MSSFDHHTRPAASGLSDPLVNLDTERFKVMTSQFAQMAAAEGLPVVAYRQAPVHFPALAAAARRQVLHTFGRYVEVAHEVRGEGWALVDDRRFLWGMIKKLGLRPDAELFDKLEDDDFIEILDTRDGIQIYRNLRYFSVCSYTLDDLLCRPWYELFYRDPKVVERIMGTVEAVLTARRAGIFHYNAGVHVLDEISSESRYRCTLENRFLTPLFDHRRTVAAAVNVTRLVSCVARSGASAP
jgi:hypothetical protein